MFTRAVFRNDASLSAWAVDPLPYAVGFPVFGFVRSVTACSLPYLNRKPAITRMSYCRRAL